MAIAFTLDCADLAGQARFWSAALGYEVAEITEHHATLVPTPGADGTPRLYLQRVAERKVAKNRMHLDWDVPDMEAEADRLEAMGATRIGANAIPGVAWITLCDPEGNEFCVEQFE